MDAANRCRQQFAGLIHVPQNAIQNRRITSVVIGKIQLGRSLGIRAGWFVFFRQFDARGHIA